MGNFSLRQKRCRTQQWEQSNGNKGIQENKYDLINSSSCAFEC